MKLSDLQSKKGLVQQLRTLSRQHEQVLDAYERKVEARIAEAQQAAAGSKRAGPPVVEGPEAKRQRQLAERNKRKQDIWGEVIKIVEKIRKNNKADPFKAPVDAIKLGIPDYFNIIRSPMDLGTVMRKLKSNPRIYGQPSEVATDMRLIWQNCRMYNGPMHKVTQQANHLSEAFEKAWGQGNIEHKWQVEIKREEREEQMLAQPGAEAAGDDDLITQLRSKRNVLGDLIAAKDVQDNVPLGSLGDVATDRDMTFEEKRKLSAHMASIPGEKLTKVLDIILESEDVDNLEQQDSEVELDLDALSNATLWRLKVYVDGVLTASTGAPPKKTAGSRAPNKAPPSKQAAPGGAPPAAAPMAPPAAPQAAAMPQPAGAGAGGMPAPGQPAQQQQQQAAAAQQQQPGSPQHSGGASAGEVVASTAGGAGLRAVTHQTLGDAFTVAQSGTNVRPSTFVKSRPRAMLPPGAAGEGGEATAMDVDGELNADWASLAKPEQPAAAAGGSVGAPADAPAVGQQQDQQQPPQLAQPEQQPQEQPGGSGQAGAAAAAAAAAGQVKAEAAPAPAAEPPAGAPQPAGVKQEAPAAAASAAAPAAVAAPPAAPAPQQPAPAGAPAAAAAPPPPAGAAAGAGGGGDMWDEFAAKAAAEEAKLRQAKEEEAQRQRDEAERKREAEEAERQKEAERQAEVAARKEAAIAELAVKSVPLGGAAEDSAVQADVDALRAAGDSVDPGTAPMDMDGDTSDELDGGPPRPGFD